MATEHCSCPTDLLNQFVKPRAQRAVFQLHFAVMRNSTITNLIANPNLLRADAAKPMNPLRWQNHPQANRVTTRGHRPASFFNCGGTVPYVRNRSPENKFRFSKKTKQINNRTTTRGPLDTRFNNSRGGVECHQIKSGKVYLFVS